MGKDRNESIRPKAVNGQPYQRRTGFVTFTPLEREFPGILGLIPNDSDWLRPIERLLTNGVGLTISSTEDGGGVKVLVFDRTLHFEERMFYSFHASTLERALAQVVFVLEQGILEYDNGLVWKGRQVSGL